MTAKAIHLPFDVPLLSVQKLSAGRTTCMYENGNLRYITVDGKEVVRMIYPAVRDRQWSTARYEIRNEVIKRDECGFTVEYTALYQLNDIRYEARCLIEGGNNSISFSMSGVAMSNFQSNRIGICVLHPLDCAGKSVTITHADGSSSASVFPQLISPHQPFKGIAHMRWGVNEEWQAAVEFEGDVFETEDQRNWTDASYKTYSRPLDLPYPFQVNEGDRINQKVTLTVSNKQRVSSLNEGVSVHPSKEKVPFPAIGISRRSGFRRLSEEEIKLLRKIPFEQYRVEVRMSDDDWRNELSLGLSEAKALQTKVELSVFFSGDIKREPDLLLAELLHDREFIKSLLILDEKGTITPVKKFSEIYGTFKQTIPGMQVGYGTNANFAELNRNRPLHDQYDFVSFSINPQAHATDTRSIIENLSAQGDVIRTVRAFAPGKPVHVSPVTLTGRKNDGSDADARLQTSFVAWWMLQAIRNLRDAKSITFFETIGGKGILREAGSHGEGEYEHRLVTPLYEVLRTIHEFQPVYIVVQHDEAFLIENASGERLAFHGEARNFVRI